MDKVRYKIKDLRYNTTNNKHQVGGKLHDDIMVVVKYIMKGMYDSTKESVLADLSKYSDSKSVIKCYKYLKTFIIVMIKT